MKQAAERCAPAQYREIAADIARRIISGEFSVGERLYGRSLMSSEYRVSPETIRRAFRLLADMKVLEVRPQSGAEVLSIDSARHYLDGTDAHRSGGELKNRFRALLQEQERLSKELEDVSSALLKRQEVLFTAQEEDFGVGEVKVSGSSWVIGKSIGALAFWQATHATIIAIRRGQNLIISPGPFAELYKNDCIIYVAKEADFDWVSEFINDERNKDGKEKKQE